MVQRGDCRDLEHQVIGIAVQPILAWLEGLDDRVPGGVVVFGGVASGRLVAASDMSAGHAEAQVEPSLADGQAFLATVAGRDDITYRPQVGAYRVHGNSSSAAVWARRQVTSGRRSAPRMGWHSHRPLPDLQLNWRFHRRRYG